MINENLTIIIPFLNEGENAIKTIAGIADSTRGDTPRVIAINDASTDGFDYAAAVSKIDGDITYIQNPQRKGVAGCRNMGVEMCQTSYFLFLDAHMKFITKNWASMLVQYLQQYPWDMLCLNTCIMETDWTIKKGKIRKYASNVDFAAWNEKSATVRSALAWKYAKKYTEGANMDITQCIMGAGYATSKAQWQRLHGLRGLIQYGMDEQFISLKFQLSGAKCFMIHDIKVGHIYKYGKHGFDCSWYAWCYNQIVAILTLFEGTQRDALLANCKALNTQYDAVYNMVNKDWCEQEHVYLRNIFGTEYEQRATEFFNRLNGNELVLPPLPEADWEDRQRYS
jgi:glycosyltransferase involved in cell wall biosynthesis